MTADPRTYATHIVAVQHARDLDGDAIREVNALRLARTHGLTIATARVVAELAFDPGRRR